MNIFGIGPLELLVVLAVALIFLGPEKLPEMARALGKAVYQFQQMIEPFRAEINRAIEPVEEVQREMKQTLHSVPPAIGVPTTQSAAPPTTLDRAVAASTGEPATDDQMPAESHTIAPPDVPTAEESANDAG